MHSFGHLAENLVFRHLALIEKLCLWSPRAEGEVMKSDREVTKAQVFREVTKAVHQFSRHFWLSWPGGAELGKMSFTIEFVYENYTF